MDWAWTGVGTAYFLLLTACRSLGSRPNEEKSVTVKVFVFLEVCSALTSSGTSCSFNFRFILVEL